MRHIISNLALGAAVTIALAAGAGSSAMAAPVGTQCASVPYGWAGTTLLAPGQSFSTGVVVPSDVGVQLAVQAFDVSTVDPAPNAVAIWIGQGVVANGVSVAGGEIAVTNDSAGNVMLTRVELSLQRCYQVASAAPVLTAPADTDLPATGSPSAAVIALAGLFTVCGSGLVLATRRRVTALAHDR